MCWNNDASVPFRVGTLGPHTVLPISSTVQNTLQNPFLELPSPTSRCFPESHRWPEISFLSKVTLVVEKARSHRAPNLGCRGDESLRWFNLFPKNAVRDMMHEWARCRDEAASYSLHPPESLLNHQSSFHGRMFKLTTNFDADSLLYSLHYCERDSHTVHTLTQWRLPPPLTSTVKSSLFTHAHYSPLSLAARLYPRCTLFLLC